MAGESARHAQRLRHLAQREAKSLEIKATIVNVEQDASSGTRTTYKVLDETGAVIPNLVWCHLYGGDDNDLVQAWNINGTKGKNNQPVLIKENDPGDYEVLRLRAKEADELYGSAAPNYSGPVQDGNASYNPVPGDSFEPFRLERTSESGPFTVEVLPGNYTYFGTPKQWPGGSIDLTDDVPATTGYWAYIWVGIWPYDHSVRAVSSVEVSRLGLLDADTLANMAASMEGLIVSDAIKLQEGMTEIDRADYFTYARHTFGSVALPANPIVLSSAFHHLPANRRAVWYGPVTLTGDFVIEGEITIL